MIALCYGHATATEPVPDVQWQTNTQVGICYLMYRLIVAILLLAVLACSALDIGRSEPMLEHHYAKWWIYLTHWALIACALQAWLAAIIVTKGLMIDRNEFEWNIHVARESRLHAVYWVVYTIATVYSFIVTIVYWTFVYDPEVHRVDAVNLMVHVLNSVIMLIDLTIVGHPIRLNHAYWTTGIGVAYALFSVIYYLAGGTDSSQSPTNKPPPPPPPRLDNLLEADEGECTTSVRLSPVPKHRQRSATVGLKAASEYGYRRSQNSASVRLPPVPTPETPLQPTRYHQESGFAPLHADTDKYPIK
ncbi:hypothetical protein RP20_CCG017578 [Aedes albopictus]|nr:hypothetical protein RP20_CCG017578 [Aedes albopictus]